MLDTVLKFVTLGTVVVGSLAVYTALRNNGRQVGVQIFLNYSERVQSLRHGLASEGARDRAIEDILYVILEFYTLRKKGYVSRGIWDIWEADISRLLASDLVDQRWPNLKSLFVGHEDFVAWVHSRGDKRKARPRG